MKAGEKTGLRGRELVARLTGIKTPVGGIDWQPPLEEQSRAREVLTYLAEQRALWDPLDAAIGSFVTQSIVDLRGRLRSEIEDLRTGSVLREGLTVMHAACRRFLEENQSPRSGYGPPYEAQLHGTLGELRALCGIHLARIACAYDLEVEARLAGILPPESD
ncbi:MAG: hypothetical protein MUC88_24030 [Planctomycetes bacterium]|jgi:hypothetical protein|nr:hypothetical protein [Planctomycetota bacterium]